MANKKVYYSWGNLEKDIGILTKRIKAISFNFKNIYGVPRGGLIPAVMLSHQLDLPLITERQLISKDTLIVDDISDTGKTLQKLLKGKKYKGIATLHKRITTNLDPDFYVNTINDEWIVYPFETEGSSKYDN